MRNNNVEINILIRGRSITEYTHNGKIFVEGRDGSAFEIELINHNNFPAEAIVSVDGLSVIDGKEAGPSSGGYLLKGGETLRVPGWKLDNKSVAAFVFAGKGKSYAQQSTGDSRNTGVIGLIAYAGRGQFFATYQSPAGIQSAYSQTSTTWAQGPRGPVGVAGAQGPRGPIGPTGVTLGMSSLSSLTSTCGVNTSTICSNAATASNSAGPFEISQFYSGNSNSRSYEETVLKNTKCAQPVKQTLGTAFGQKQDFGTETVSFNRGDMIAMTVIYYDDARGLAKRGIDMKRKKRNHTPDAFPAMKGCAPPRGWQG